MVSSLEGETPILQIETNGHTDEIRFVHFIDNGEKLVSVSQDKTIRIWNVETQNLEDTIRGYVGEGQIGSPRCAAISDDSSILAIGTILPDGGAILVHNLRDPSRSFVLMGHEGPVISLAFSPDQKYLASGGSDQVVHIWNLELKKSIKTLDGDQKWTGWVNCVEFSSDGSKIVTGSEDGFVRLWAMPRGTLLKEFKAHSYMTTTLGFAQNDTLIVTGGFDGAVRLWDVRHGQLVRVLEEHDKNNPYIGSVAVIRGGDQVIVAADRKDDSYSLCRLYDIEGNLLKSHLGTGWITSQLAISPDGQRFAAATSGTKHSILIWRFDTESPEHRLAGGGSAIRTVAFGRSGDELIWRTWQNDRIWTLRRPKDRTGSIKIEPLRRWPGSAIEKIHKIGNISLNTRSRSGAAWGEPGGEQSILQIFRDGQLDFAILKEDDGIIHNVVTLSPNAGIAITGGHLGSIHAYDIKSGETIGRFTGHTNSIESLAVSPDGKYLVSGSLDQTVRLWEIETRKLLCSVFASDEGEWICWTPDGYYAASPNGDRHVGWQVNGGYNDVADFYIARQFRRFLHRPEVVSTTIGPHESDRSAAIEEVPKMSLETLIMRSPVGVIIDDVQNRPDGTSRIQVRLLDNKTTSPERISLFVNGAQLLSRDQRDLAGAKPGDKLNYAVKFREKKNTIKAIVENTWAEAEDIYQYTTDEIRGDSAMGDLLFIGIGVNRYPQLSTEQQLSTPSADVIRLSQTYKALEGVLYNAVQIFPLTDEENLITATAAIKFASQHAAMAGKNDTTVFFFAGHGKTDFGGNYHFITSDTDVEGDFENSFTWRDLHEILDYTLGKRTVIVDTCEAGSVIKEHVPDLSRLEKDVHDVNAAILSGSSRQQPGWETESGGVFTSAIIQGLNNHEDYSGNSLYIAKLSEYLVDTVPKMNREIVSKLYRGLVVSPSETITEEKVLGAVQNPVILIPDGMQNFIAYMRRDE